MSDAGASGAVGATAVGGIAQPHPLVEQDGVEAFVPRASVAVAPAGLLKSTVPVTISLRDRDGTLRVDADVTREGFGLLHNLAEWSRTASSYEGEPPLDVRVRERASAGPGEGGRNHEEREGRGLTTSGVPVPATPVATPSAKSGPAEPHQCDGENTWCDDCEAREKAKGLFPSPWVDALCEVMHDAYEDEARRVGWVTQAVSRVPWPDLPYGNKAAMRAGVRAMLAALFRGGKPWPDEKDDR